MSLWKKKKKEINTLEDTAPIYTEYPRPQLKRESFLCLNGTWKLGKKKIMVPFPPQSTLSEYEGRVQEHLIYEKQFRFAAGDAKKRTLLHFGAVDQICQVYLNGVYIGRHVGGYLPFTFDVTDAILFGDEINHLEVRVLDSLSRIYPYGKQAHFSHGMWYTQVSGIWGSVWLEQVPLVYINRIKLTPDMEGFQYTVFISGLDELQETDEVDISELTVAIRLDNGETISQKASVFHDVVSGYIRCEGHPCESGAPYRVRHWCASDPYLYPLEISFFQDKVESYVAFRTIEVREINHLPRVCLNGQPILLQGVLDQGYFQEGIFLPETEKGYEEDVKRMQALGMNLLRKHIKIEPEAFYYACDRLGMLVMQDMVQSGHYSLMLDTVIPNLSGKKRPDALQFGLPKRKEFFEFHMEETVEHLYNHPCIVMWTLFNEGWGQFETDRLFERLKSHDRTRLVDAASGWFEQNKSDFISEHIYYKNQDMRTGTRPLLLSECGGFSLPVVGHIWHSKAGYGYGKCADTKELMARIQDMDEGMIGPYIRKGLCGYVYTQLSDVENEINGMYTYDRQVCKVDAAQMRAFGNRLQEIFEETVRE